MHPKAVFGDFSKWDWRHFSMIGVLAILDWWFIWDAAGFVISKALGVTVAAFIILLVYMIMGRVFEGSEKKVLSFDDYETKDYVMLVILGLVGIGLGIGLYKVLDVGSGLVQFGAMVIADYFLFAFAKTSMLDEKNKKASDSKKPTAKK